MNGDGEVSKPVFESAPLGVGVCVILAGGEITKYRECFQSFLHDDDVDFFCVHLIDDSDRVHVITTLLTLQTKSQTPFVYFIATYAETHYLIRVFCCMMRGNCWLVDVADRRAFSKLEAIHRDLRDICMWSRGVPLSYKKRI